MAVAVVRALRSPRQLRSADDLVAFEQELVDQYALASSGAGISDHQVSCERRINFEFLRYLNRPLWTAREADADRFLVHQRKERALTPLDLDKIRTALNSRNVAQAAIVGPVAFHGLHVDDLRRRKLTDLPDGRPRVNARVIPLATPTLQRLLRRLDYRDMRFPNTINPHMFIHYRTAGKPDDMVGRRWTWLMVGEGLSVTQIREDRILAEAHATGGDMRALIDLFGISPKASSRYLNTLDHPDLTRLDTAEGDGIPRP